jgi:hypothetical protein
MIEELIAQLRKEKESSETQILVRSVVTPSFPVDQMTPPLGELKKKKENVMATKVRRIVTGQASGQTMQPMPGGGAR